MEVLGGARVWDDASEVSNDPISPLSSSLNHLLKKIAFSTESFRQNHPHTIFLCGILLLCYTAIACSCSGCGQNEIQEKIEL